MRAPETKTERIEDPVLLQSIDKLQEYDSNVLKSSKSLKKFLQNKDVPVSIMRHAKNSNNILMKC